MDVLP